MTTEHWQILIPAIVALLGALTVALQQRGRAKGLARELDEVRSIPPKRNPECTKCLRKLKRLRVELRDAVASIRGEAIKSAEDEPGSEPEP